MGHYDDTRDEIDNRQLVAERKRKVSNLQPILRDLEVIRRWAPNKTFYWETCLDKEYEALIVKIKAELYDLGETCKQD